MSHPAGSPRSASRRRSPATARPVGTSVRGTRHNSAKTKDKHWDDYDDPEAAVAFYLGYLTAALPHLAPNSAIYQWHAHRRQALVEAAWTAAGLLVHQQLIWAKARGVLTHSHYLWAHEPCFYGWVEGAPPTRKVSRW